MLVVDTYKLRNREDKRSGGRGREKYQYEWSWGNVDLVSKAAANAFKGPPRYFERQYDSTNIDGF